MSVGDISEGSLARYRQFLLLVAGLGGLLYGVDVGIIGSALPYLEATSHLTAGQSSSIVAAVLLGSVFSTLFAGLLADLMGRKLLMILSGLTFVLSIPIIALSQGYGPLLLGRLLQGMSGGFIGVVVPLYLAEVLPASNRGKGTSVFQWLLTLGIMSAAAIGIFFSYHVAAVAKLNDAAALFATKNTAWRSIFWVSLPPGLLFTIGAFMVSESPRWLFRRGKVEAALEALRRSRNTAEADAELQEMRNIAEAERVTVAGDEKKETLLKRKYVIPFILACLVLSFNQSTGVNSIIGYNTNILLQSGLSDLWAHWGYLMFTIVNFLSTIIGMTLIDKKGRKFLFTVGTGGVVVMMTFVGFLFLRTERSNVDVRDAVQATAQGDTLNLKFTPQAATSLLMASGSSGKGIDPNRASLAVVYSCGDYTAATTFVRSDDPSSAPVSLSRKDCLPSSAVDSFFKNPFANFTKSQSAPLRVEHATLGTIPGQTNGWITAVSIYLYMMLYAIGPGVCVWLALSELMPTRIRSNGMSIALLLNQAVATVIAAVFLPVVSKYGYSRMFFIFAICTVGYFVTTAFFLPETKGKTLEEIEAFFERGTKSA